VANQALIYLRDCKRNAVEAFKAFLSRKKVIKENYVESDSVSRKLTLMVISKFDIIFTNFC
jgi:hypothetical protein